MECHVWTVAFGIIWCLKLMIRVINLKRLCEKERGRSAVSVVLEDESLFHKETAVHPAASRLWFLGSAGPRVWKQLLDAWISSRA